MSDKTWTYLSTKGWQEVQIDKADAAACAVTGWMVRRTKEGKVSEIVSTRHMGPKGHQVRLERFLLDPLPGQVACHLDKNRANCQRSNLMACSPHMREIYLQYSLSMASEVCPGTFFDADAERWVGIVEMGGATHHTGYHETREAAARSLDELRHFPGIEGEQSLCTTSAEYTAWLATRAA